AQAQRDPVAQERLYLSVAAGDPEARRLPIFRAALAAKHDALAESVGRELLPAYQRNHVDQQDNADGFLRNYSEADREFVARNLAETNQRLGNMQADLGFYKIAMEIQPSDALRRTSDSLKAQLDLQARNAARRPVVTAEIDQDHLVRPKETK